MSNGNGNSFVGSVRGDCDLVYYNFPISDLDLDRIHEECNCEILSVTRACIALCRARGVDLILDNPLLDIPSYMGFTELRVDTEEQL